MSNGKGKAFEFKGRQQKQEGLQKQDFQERVMGVMTSCLNEVIGLRNKHKALDLSVQQANGYAKIADWRSLAIMQLVIEKFEIPEQDIFDRVNKLQEESFEKENAADDAKLGLEPFDGPAELDHYAIAKINFYKGGVKLTDEQQIFRSKFKIGDQEFFPEIDLNVVGMSPGETKKIKIENGNHIDEAEVTILGLRKAKPAPPKLEAIQPQEGTDGATQQEEKPEEPQAPQA